MKNIKKLLAVVVAMTMALMLAVPAFAATVTVPEGDRSNHKYVAYQVFTGDQAENSTVLSNVAWGDGIDSAAFAAALAGDTDSFGTSFEGKTEAADIAEILSKNPAFANRVAELAYANKIGTGTELNKDENALANGYYLIVDESTSVESGDALNKAMLQVTGSMEIKDKTDAPGVIKKVQENAATTATAPTDYTNQLNDAADYNIGDAVPFRLVGNVPDMSSYDTYKYMFTDTASVGLTLPAGTDFSVYYVPATAGTSEEVATNEAITATTSGSVALSPVVAVAAPTDAGTIATITFADLKAALPDGTTGGYIVVDYTATLNEKAVVATPTSLLGNPNEVYLTYSNNPNKSGSGDTDNTGDTPKDEVVVFTYTLPVSKVDGSNANAALKGAEFALFATEQAAKDAIANNNTTDALTFTGSNGSFIKAAATATGATSTLTSDDNGKYTIKGLDTGAYYLVETKTPDNSYNKLDAPVKIEVLPTLNDGRDNHVVDKTDDQLTALSIKQDGSTTTDVTIANNKGATLPSTGGMGTTLFTIVGIGLMVGAAVLLIAKRRTDK